MRRALTPKPQSPSNATCDGSGGNIRKRGRKSATLDGLEMAAALYGPTVAPYTAEPALSPAEIRRRQHERKIRRAARRLEAAVRAEVERGGDGR